MNFPNLDKAFNQLLFEVWSDGLNVKSRGSSQKELLFKSFVIDDPTDLMISSPARKFSPSYATAEWLWYLSANPKVNNIGKMAKIWTMIQDDAGEAESNYGCYLKPQWEWTLGELLKDRDSRRATIVINQPYHKDKNVQDYPCTHYLHFFIREDELHMGVNMRSNDIVFGLCNDVFTFCMFQQLMLNELNSRGANVRLGSYYHHAGSLHLYERHFSMARKILAEPAQKTSMEKFVLNDDFSSWDSLQAMAIPEEEMTKEEIAEFTARATEEIYDEHFRAG